MWSIFEGSVGSFFSGVSFELLTGIGMHGEDFKRTQRSAKPRHCAILLEPQRLSMRS